MWDRTICRVSSSTSRLLSGESAAAAPGDGNRTVRMGGAVRPDGIAVGEGIAGDGRPLGRAELGGELAALVLIDSVVRLLPGALGDDMSAVDESFSRETGLLEYAQYTRPARYRDMAVPGVLLSGDHARVDRWRRLSSLERTARWRPDLIDEAMLDDEELSVVRSVAHDREGVGDGPTHES